MKKLILVLLVTLFAIAANAQKFTAYAFGYYYDYNSKTFYVSNIVSCSNYEYSRSNYFNTTLQNQWHDKFKAVCGANYYKYTAGPNFWYDAKSKADQEHTKVIGEYNSKSFIIIKVNDFNFYDN